MGWLAAAAASRQLQLQQWLQWLLLDAWGADTVLRPAQLSVLGPLCPSLCYHSIVSPKTLLIFLLSSFQCYGVQKADFPASWCVVSIMMVLVCATVWPNRAPCNCQQQVAIFPEELSWFPFSFKTWICYQKTREVCPIFLELPAYIAAMLQ